MDDINAQVMVLVTPRLFVLLMGLVNATTVAAG